MDTTVILANINQSYVNLSRIVKSEMEANLAFKSVTLNDNKHAQGRSRAKPWWSDKLTELWNLRCEAESRIRLIENGRQLFLHCQRNVDREVRAAKRQYWYQQQQELLDAGLAKSRLSFVLSRPPAFTGFNRLLLTITGFY